MTHILHLDSSPRGNRSISRTLTKEFINEWKQIYPGDRVTSELGNATQTNIEAFYNFPVSNSIRITPLVQVIVNPANQESNGTIVTGTVRTVFSF
jgi:carbohydrate-selective porin OprB